MVRNRRNQCVFSSSILSNTFLFVLSFVDAGNGLAEVVIADARGRKDTVPVSVKQTAPGKFRCEYVAREPGLHAVNVYFAGRPIPNSPYNVNVSPCKYHSACWLAFDRVAE